MLSRSLGESGDDGKEKNGDEEDGSRADFSSVKGNQGVKEIVSSKSSSVWEEDVSDVPSVGACVSFGVGSEGDKKVVGVEVLVQAEDRPEVFGSRSFNESIKEGDAVFGSSRRHCADLRSDSGHSPPIKDRPVRGKINGSQRWDYNSCTSLFVNNIPPLVSVLKLKDWFGFFGSVVDVFIPRKRSKSSGSFFAFVRFNLEVEAVLACEKIDGSVFEGYVLEVNIARYPRGSPQSSSKSFLGKNAIDGAVFVVTGEKSRVIGTPFSNSGALVTGAVGESKTNVNSRVAAGISYAQILKSGDIAKGVTQVSCGVRTARDEERRNRAGAAENPEHLKAVLEKSYGMGDGRGRLFCDSDLLVDSCVHRSKEECCVISSLREDSSIMLEDVNDDIDIVAIDEKMGGGSDSADVRTSESCFEKVEGVDSGISNVCELSSSCIEEEGEQNYNSNLDAESISEEVKDKVDGDEEEPPLSPEEKSEIRFQVRAIIHDALRIGKAMGINITARDARMIKRFAVLRHFDKEKWRMNFDNEEDQLI